MAINTAQGIIMVREEFLRHYEANTNLPVNINVATGGTAAVVVEHGGALRLTLTAAETAGASAIGKVNLEPSKVTCVVVRARLRISDVSKASVFFGLTDADNDTVIIEDEDGTLNTVATDAVGFLLEGEQEGAFQAIAVKNNSDSAQVLLDSVLDPVDGEAVELSLEAWKDGRARFIINGQVVADLKDFYDPTEQYAIALGADGRGTAHTVDYEWYEIGTEREN